MRGTLVETNGDRRFVDAESGVEITFADPVVQAVVASPDTAPGFRVVRLVASTEGNTRGQYAYVVTSTDGAFDAGRAMAGLQEILPEHGREVRREMRMHAGRRALEVWLEDVPQGELHEGHALLTTDGRCAVMLIDVLEEGSDASGRASESLYDGLRFPESESPADMDD
ncbi:MAG: hypothetical protein J0L92_35700 [Deltaproteobacteria bacterium]|nr:hypothetical protein [Deltaproteobacteria bacterium]